VRRCVALLRHTGKCGLRDYGTAKWEGGDPACEHSRNGSDTSTSTFQGGKATTNHQQEPYRSVCPKCGARRVDSQIGLESTPEAYVEQMIGVFREVRRILKPDGTLWLNLGDSFARDFAKGGSGPNGKHDYVPDYGNARRIMSESKGSSDCFIGRADRAPRRNGSIGLKPKDLIGIPWMVAFALRADGWWLRSEITWCKRSSMPESVTDRPSCATEKIFLLSKSQRYFYNADAVKQPASDSFANDSRWETGSTDKNEKQGYLLAMAQNPKRVHRMFDKQRGHGKPHAGFNDRLDAGEANGTNPLKVNLRNYWLLSPEPCAEAHFATFPSEIPRRAILAGSRPGDTVLDPFAGTFTTGMVALELGRKTIGIELNPEYVKIAQHRTNVTSGLALA